MTNKKISGGTVHKLPLDLRKALIADRLALAAWEKLSSLARNEWICWVMFVKKEETRKEHIKRLVDELKKGKRRPCCWLGCTHRTDKPISPSVQAVLNKRSKKIGDLILENLLRQVRKNSERLIIKVTYHGTLPGTLHNNYQKQNGERKRN